LNWQYDHLVIGVEGDWQWTGQKDSLCRDCTVTPNTLTQTIEHKIPWFATVRGRVGFAVGPALFYATGGVAFAEIDLNTVNTRPPFSPGTASIRFSKTGSVVGGGIEAALGGNWTAKVEYLYLDLGGISATVPDFVPGSVVVLNSDVRDHVARFGLNYRFGGPVVARY
jgi:outer membrane immunogenic protein